MRARSHIVHVGVFQMEGAGISIIEKPRPLHNHDTLNPAPAPSHAKSPFPRLDGALLSLHDSQPRVGEDRRRPPSARGTGAHNHTPSPGLVEGSDGALDDARAQTLLVLCAPTAGIITPVVEQHNLDASAPRAPRSRHDLGPREVRRADLIAQFGLQQERLHGELRCQLLIPDRLQRSSHAHGHVGELDRHGRIGGYL